MRAVFAKLFRRKLVLAGALILATVALLALFAPWLTPYDPMALKILDRLQSPRAGIWPLVALTVTGLGAIVAAILASPALRNLIEVLAEKLY